MHKHDLCRHAVSVCVCLSVCVSVTFVSCVKTNKDIFEIFSQSGSHTILLFSYQTGWRCSDGSPPNGGVECRWGRQKISIMDEYLASLHTGLQCYQPYELWSVENKAATNGIEPSTHGGVRCSHKTTKCLWWARRYTPETEVKPPRHNPLGHNPVFCCRRTS